jgi:phosphoenolpyruvate carboxylase
MEGRVFARHGKADAKDNEEEALIRKFVRLLAHPTQFYPGAVLGIINDLTNAIRKNNLLDIKQLLAQLGKTPFIKMKSKSLR